MASREESVVGSAAAQLAASAAKLAAAAAASASSSTSVVVRSTELAVAPDAPPKDYYYPLYRLLLRWKQFALPPSAPHAALLPPPDATTTTPLSHLLASLAGLQRARRGAHERLRSVRRWQMLYASRQRLPTGRLAPPDSSWQASCLTRAAASWAEWRHYRVEGARAAARAADQLTTLRLHAALAAWSEAAALLGVRQFFSLLPRGNHSSAQAAALLSLLDRLTFHQAPAT